MKGTDSTFLRPPPSGATSQTLTPQHTRELFLDLALWNLFLPSQGGTSKSLGLLPEPAFTLPDFTDVSSSPGLSLPHSRFSSQWGAINMSPELGGQPQGPPLRLSLCPKSLSPPPSALATCHLSLLLLRSPSPPTLLSITCTTARPHLPSLSDSCQGFPTSAPASGPSPFLLLVI